MLNMFITLITLMVVMVSQIYAYVRTHHIKYMQFPVYQLHLNKAIYFLKFTLSESSEEKKSPYFVSTVIVKNVYIIMVLSLLKNGHTENNC